MPAENSTHALALANRGLVTKICRSVGLRPHHAIWQDAHQDGMMALLKAADRFDPERGTAFSTYAWSWVVQAVKGTMCGTSVVHEPVKRVSRRAAQNAAYARMSAKDQEQTPPPAATHPEVIPLPESLTYRNAEDDTIETIQTAKLRDRINALPSEQREAILAALNGEQLDYGRRVGLSRGSVDYRIKKAFWALTRAQRLQQLRDSQREATGQ